MQEHVKPNIFNNRKIGWHILLFQLTFNACLHARIPVLLRFVSYETTHFDLPSCSKRWPFIILDVFFSMPSSGQTKNSPQNHVVFTTIYAQKSAICNQSVFVLTISINIRSNSLVKNFRLNYWDERPTAIFPYRTNWHIRDFDIYYVLFNFKNILGIPGRCNDSSAALNNV